MNDSPDPTGIVSIIPNDEVDSAAALTEPSPRVLRVMEAHRLADCAEPRTCWYEPHRKLRSGVEPEGCPAAANQRGAHIACDGPPRHGATHANREHGLIWSGVEEASC